MGGEGGWGWLGLVGLIEGIGRRGLGVEGGLLDWTCSSDGNGGGSCSDGAEGTPTMVALLFLEVSTESGGGSDERESPMADRTSRAARSAVEPLFLEASEESGGPGLGPGMMGGIVLLLA